VGSQAQLKVFSDGSGQDGYVGASAVIYKKGVRRPISHLKAHLGPSTKHTTYEGEVVGGILGLWLASTTPGTIAKQISLYTDNQSLVAAIRNPKAVSGQYLLQEAHRAANSFLFNLKIKWISGHSRVIGNEEADKLAKEAAEGKASRRQDLPPILRNDLPTSASAAKQAQHEKLMRCWRREWVLSPRRIKMEQFDSTFPFNGFRKHQSKMFRKQASTLFQVRTGHFPLNSYLHRINKSETKYCQQCDPDDEAREETVKHFLFECDAYTAQRQKLAKTIGRHHLNLQDIMAHPKYMKALFHYITKTNRFPDAH
jgi:ribonuclease HI